MHVNEFQPSAITWNCGDQCPLLLSDRPKPLDGRIISSRGTGIRKIPNTGGSFLLSKYTFPGFSSFLSVRSAFATRCWTPLDLGSANVGLKHGLAKSGTFYKFQKFQRTFKLQRTFFGIFEIRAPVLNLVPHVCVFTHLSMRVYTHLYIGTAVHTHVHCVCVYTTVRVPLEVPLEVPARSRR
jgi:hypothetical protein